MRSNQLQEKPDIVKSFETENDRPLNIQMQPYAMIRFVQRLFQPFRQTDRQTEHTVCFVSARFTPHNSATDTDKQLGLTDHPDYCLH